MASFEPEIGKLEQALLSLDRLSAKEILEKTAGTSNALELIDKLIVPTLEKIGEYWEQGKIALAQVYVSGRFCEDFVDKILPPAGETRKEQPKMAICVLEDHHFLGKRIVYSLLRATGWALLDYERGDVDSIIRQVERDQIEVLLVSVLMLPSALRVKELTSRLKALEWGVKVVVGGAPFRLDEQLWKTVGADAVCRTAADILPLLNEGML